MKAFLILSALLLAFVVASSCGDDDDSSEDEDASDDEIDTTTTTTTTPTTTTTTMPTTTDDTWTDPSSGLIWQVTPSKNKNLIVGIDYCENLDLAGLHEWQLPTISELRTLIRGCEGTVTGGSCDVTDYCLDTSCQNESCLSCENGAGPNNGCFGPFELPGECDVYWSRSLVADLEEQAWFVSFGGGFVHLAGKNSLLSVRCVRFPMPSRFPARSLHGFRG